MYLVPNIHPGSGSAGVPTVTGNFAVPLNDYTTLSTTSTMPSGGSITRAGNAMLYDSTGKLTWAPNNQYINSGSATNTARTITTVAGVNYYIWIQTSTGTATIVASGTNTTTFNGSTSGTFTAFTATAGTLTLTPTSNFANITQVVVAQITYETALRSGDNYVTGAAAYYGPRFDVDPVTLQNKGLLVEGARTNFASYSSDYTNSYWTKRNSTTINSTTALTTAPDGTVTAQKILPALDGAANGIADESGKHLVGRTISFYAKKAETTVISITSGAGENIDFNLSTGVASGVNPVYGNVGMQSVGNEWWRCYYTNVTTVGFNFYIGASGGTGGVRGFYIWGIQYETGTFRTSYLPVTATSTSPTNTRAADAFTLSGYTNRLIESFYIDEATGGSWSANINASATSPLTISTPTFGWVTSVRAYTNAYAGDISSPSWLAGGSDGTAGGYSPSVRSSNATYYDSTGALTWAPNNLAQQSADVSAAFWASGFDSGNTPTATSINFTSASGYKLAPFSSGVAVGQTYIFSVVMSSGTKSTANLRIYDNGGGSGANTNFTLTSTPTRYSVIWTTTNAPTAIYFGWDNRVAAGGDGTTGTINVSQMQVERVTYQTSPRAYIPTTSAAVYQPRYDYDPSVTPATPRGMLIEEQRVNLLLQSQTFNTGWTLSGLLAFGSSGSIVDATIAPDGTVTADKIVENTSPGVDHFVRQTFTGTAAPYTFSFYAKAGERIWTRIRFFDGTATPGDAYFNISTGVLGTVNAGTASITPVGNGWYRCSVVATMTASASCRAEILTASANGTAFYTGDGVSGIYIWGAQVEHAGTIASPTSATFATSYIPTTTDSVTRVADVVKLSGSALTPIQGTSASAIIQLDMFNQSTATTQATVVWSDNAVSNLFTIGTFGNTVYPQKIVAGSAATITLQTFTQNVTFRAAAAFDSAGIYACMNNGAVSSQPKVGSLPVTQGYLGSSLGTSGFIDGHVQSLAVYNQRLPDAILKQKSSVNAPY